MSKLFLYITISFSCFMLASSCSQKKEENKDPDATITESETISLDEEQSKIAGLSHVLFKQGSITKYIKVSGVIDVPPQNMYSLSLPLGGYLKYTKLLPGMHFNKGDVIALIDDPKFIELQQNYLNAQARVVMLKDEYERQLELNKSKAVSDKILLQSKTNYTTEKILLKSMGEQLKLIGIDPTKLKEENISGTIPLRAPIDGFVGKVNVNTGKYVSPTEVLFELVNPEDIHLSLNVFEKDINALAIGQAVTAYTNTNPNQKYPCEIILIGKEVLPDHSINVHCHFEKYNNKLVPGTFMNADIKQEQKNTWLLPLDAVQLFEGRNYIFIKENKAYKMQEVEVGIADQQFIEVLNMQDEWKGKEIAVKGAYTLLMKFKNAGDEE